MNSQQSFHFIFHFLVSWNPYDRDECHHTKPSQGDVKYVVEFQQIHKHADGKSGQVEKAKGNEPSCIWDVFLKNGLILIKLFAITILYEHTAWCCNPREGSWKLFTGVSFVGITKLVIFLNLNTSSIMTILWRMKLMLVAGITKNLRTVIFMHSFSSEIWQW